MCEYVVIFGHVCHAWHKHCPPIPKFETWTRVVQSWDMYIKKCCSVIGQFLKILLSGPYILDIYRSWTTLLCIATNQTLDWAYKSIFWQKFKILQRFVHHFNFLSELLHNQQSSPLICQYLSPSKFEVSMAQPLPKLAMATRSLRLHLGNKISCQQNFITMKNK